MSDLVLWNTVGTSDKIWGVVDHNDRKIIFWGRRNRELSFKLLDAAEEAKLPKTIEKKRKDRDYVETTFEALEAATEGFKSEFDQMLMVAILGDGYRHTSTDTLASKFGVQPQPQQIGTRITPAASRTMFTR